MAPAFSRLTLSPRKASGLLRNKPTSICSRETPSYWVSLAILRNVSPGCTTRPFPSAGLAAVSAATLGCADGRAPILPEAWRPSAEAAPRTVSTTRASATGRAVCFAAISGGSSRKVYSRTRRPAGQLSSTRKSRNGSLIGLDEVTLTTAFPPGRFSTAKRKSRRTLAKSTPACLNTSCGAKRADIPANSSLVAPISSSARKGCPRPESTVNLPRPAASANNGVSDMQEATAKAAARFLNLVCLVSVTAKP